MPLTISVRFLTGYCVTARSKTDPSPEWPPHPARLFMALAAAYFESDQDAAERDALQWLETLDPPTLFVPESASPNDANSTFVPGNYNRSDGGGNPIRSVPLLNRHPAERRFPRTHVCQDDDILRFTWNDASESDMRKHVNALKSICARVGRLGHSMSLTQLWIDLDPPSGIAPSLLPANDRYDTRLRTVSNTTGTLDRLARMFELPPDYRPNLPETHGYAATSDRALSVRGSVFDSRLEMFRIVAKGSAFRSLDIATTLRLTQQLHQAMLKNVGDLGAVPEIISGHKPNGMPSELPHVAYMPLPFVGGEFSDGHLMGLGVVVPKELAQDHQTAKSLRIGLELLVRNGLRLGSLGEWNVEEDLEQRRTGQTMSPATWTASPKGAEVWASVTPVAFDQHPKATAKSGYLNEAAGLVSQMFERIGLPKPIVRVTPISPFCGVPRACDFPRLRRKDHSERRHTHVIVEFDREVVGPILIGAGRYRGYGLLRPVPQGGES